MIVVILCLKVALRLIILLVLYSNLIGLDVVALRLEVMRYFLYSLVYLLKVLLEESMVMPLPTSAYFNQEVDYLNSIVVVLNPLYLIGMDLVYSGNYQVLLSLQLGIQKRSRCSSPSLVVLLVRSILNLMLVQEELETLLHLKQRSNHLIGLDQVRLNSDQISLSNLILRNLQILHYLRLGIDNLILLHGNYQTRSILNVITSVHSYHQLILTMD